MNKKVGVSVMPPVLYGMTPVKVNKNGDGFEPCNEDDPNWYRYVSQTGDDGKSYWANAMTADGSYFVWIPRYAYKIGKVTFAGTTSQGTIDIIFVNKNNLDENGKNLPKEYIVHPAFTFGKSELSGFWVAKYPASKINNRKVQSKPGKDIWTGLNISAIVDICYNIATDTSYGFKDLNPGETHLMKNTEWDCVVYLAHSKYGRNGYAITENSNWKLVTAEVSDVKQSTTKNVSGVFDLAGECWEYVAANIGCNFSRAGSKPIFDLIMYHRDSRYMDFYNSGITAKGDAMIETQSWQENYFVMLDDIFPFLVRGGDCLDGSGAGVFAVGASVGYGGSNYGFRFNICRD